MDRLRQFYSRKVGYEKQEEEAMTGCFLDKDLPRTPKGSRFRAVFGKAAACGSCEGYEEVLIWNKQR